jgi:hypothetical protein
LDENFGDSVLPEVEVPEVRDKVKDELEHEHEALKMENLVKTNFGICLNLRFTMLNQVPVQIPTSALKTNYFQPNNQEERNVAQ